MDRWNMDREHWERRRADARRLTDAAKAAWETTNRRNHRLARIFRAAMEWELHVETIPIDDPSKEAP
jgi:hypothetical protein